MRSWLDDPLNEILPSDFEYDGRTYFFTERAPVVEPQKLVLPDEYQLLVRDAPLFRKSFDYESTLNAFGIIENVLEHTLAVVILHEDKLVCEAATGAPTHRRIEIGVTTAEPYRGHGIASIACRRLIEICEAQGYKTWWDCAKQNIASVRLAKKLGYQDNPEYRYVWWSKKN